MKKRKTAAMLLIAIMIAAAFLPDSMTYMSHVIMIPVDELQTVMCISYDLNGDAEDLSMYDELIKELDEHICGTEIVR